MKAGIVGLPNVGKSTLLNALLNEERAIVSDIAGTTRDTIEDQISIKGVNFRFMDTAGIRETEDAVEKIGIERTFSKYAQAKLIICLLEGKNYSPITLANISKKFPDKSLLPICNKVDVLNENQIETIKTEIPEVIFISAKLGQGIEALKKQLFELVGTGNISGDETIVSNSRHYNALLKALEEVQKVKEGLEGGSTGDVMAIDIRQALFHLGEITGKVTTDDLLGNIFSNFCIWK